jgi:hypothetical protein
MGLASGGSGARRRRSGFSSAVPRISVEDNNQAGHAAIQANFKYPRCIAARVGACGSG